MSTQKQSLIDSIIAILNPNDKQATIRELEVLSIEELAAALAELTLLSDE